MSDAMNIARQRRQEHEQSIAKREREIEELREMIADLDSFIEFGQELMGSPGAQKARPEQPAQSQVQIKPAEPQIKEVRGSSDDDEWSSDEDPAKTIGNVLAARKA